MFLFCCSFLTWGSPLVTKEWEEGDYVYHQKAENTGIWLSKVRHPVAETCQLQYLEGSFSFEEDFAFVEPVKPGKVLGHKEFPQATNPSILEVRRFSSEEFGSYIVAQQITEADQGCYIVTFTGSYASWRETWSRRFKQLRDNAAEQ